MIHTWVYLWKHKWLELLVSNQGFIAYDIRLIYKGCNLSVECLPSCKLEDLRYSSKVTLHSLNIFECELNVSQVDLLICINGLYSVETAAQ